MAALPETYNPNVSNTKRVKKITAETMLGMKTTVFALQRLPRATDDIWFADVYAFITGKKEEISTHGPYYRWLGDFRSINLDSGEISTSSNLILPSIASSMVEAAVAGADKTNESVYLAFRLGMTKGDGKPGANTFHKFVLKEIQPANYKSPLDLFMQEVSAPPAIEDQSEEIREAMDIPSGDATKALPVEHKKK